MYLQISNSLIGFKINYIGCTTPSYTMGGGIISMPNYPQNTKSTVNMCRYKLL